MDNEKYETLLPVSAVAHITAVINRMRSIFEGALRIFV